MIFLRPVSVAMGLSLLSIYSFPALMPPAFSPGFSLSCFIFLRFVLVFFPVVFYLAFWAMNFVLCQAFLSISSMCASLSFGCPVMIFAFVTSSHPLLMLLNLSRVRFYLPIFGARFSSFRRRRFFVRQWGARGIFASFVGISVIVTL